MIKLRFGIEGEKRLSYKEVGERFNLSKRRARQLILAGIEAYEAISYAPVPSDSSEGTPPGNIFGSLKP